MKRLLILSFCLSFLFMGCAGWSIFPAPAVPYCTPEEQADSLIYKYLDPDTADFTIAFGTAAYVEKYPEKLPDMIKAYETIKTTVEKGLSYDGLFNLAQKELGVYTYIVVSRFVSRFQGVIMPIKVCDKRLILGHIERQQTLFSMMKKK